MFFLFFINEKCNYNFICDFEKNIIFGLWEERRNVGVFNRCDNFCGSFNLFILCFVKCRKIIR